MGKLVNARTLLEKRQSEPRSPAAHKETTIKRITIQQAFVRPSVRLLRFCQMLPVCQRVQVITSRRESNICVEEYIRMLFCTYGRNRREEMVEDVCRSTNITVLRLFFSFYNSSEMRLVWWGGVDGERTRRGSEWSEVGEGGVLCLSLRRSW